MIETGTDPEIRPMARNDSALLLRDFDALTFDCYGTLIDWERGILDGLRSWRERHRFAISDEELLTLYATAEPKQEQAHPSMRYPDILAAVLADLGEQLNADVRADEATAFGRSVRDWPAFEDSPAALAYLKQHFRLAIVSNVDRASFAFSNERLGVEFDAIITAEDVGRYKPDPRHFTFALERLAKMGVERSRVLHVAQSLFHDHEPAQAMGLGTVWINRRAGRAGTGATKPPSTVIQPDLVVTDLAALAALHRAECG
jgi:2-haloalkanoic acid dehalogenase type II